MEKSSSLSAILEAEASKSANFDALALGEGLGHGIEDQLYRELRVYCEQLRVNAAFNK